MADSQSPTAGLVGARRRLREPTRTDRFFPGALFAERYRIVHRLGKGGMGEVYRAEDLRLGQTIALKFLFESSRGDPRAFERFRDEARMARKVSHGNVCRIHDFGEIGGLAYVTMEHMEGEDLSGLRKRVGRVAPERALEIALDICRGLGAIHEQGILHRDLKPANILLDGEGRARILDFGLAAMADAVSGADVRSGTPAYMAPEQASGISVSARSDLYSLGLVLYELWTGDRLKKSERAAPPPISNKVEGVDPTIDRIVGRCLAVDPRHRPASAEAVAAGLERASSLDPGPALRAVLAFEPADVFDQHEQCYDDLLESFGGREMWDRQGYFLVFDRPWSAVSFAMACRDRGMDAARFAIEVTLVELRSRRRGDKGTGSLVLEDGSAPLARGLLELAMPAQTLLTGHAYHLARSSVRTIDGHEVEGAELGWLSHGRYYLPESDEPVEVYEVGMEGRAPLRAPPSTESITSAHESGRVPGWRPAPGAHIPQRPNFRILRPLGEGGFGEVWLAGHEKTKERRVFKFCFDGARLRGLRREVTLFRLLKEELGERSDIARVLDWNIDEAPYFVESEYTAGGDLAEWAEVQGGINKVPLEERLEVVAQVADALSAAHSIGVLHKDVKPGNILLTFRGDRSFQARLADFGVGVATDPNLLKAAGITVAGWTTEGGMSGADSASGTRLYQAPEVLEGQPPTVQADIYSLGVVLYQVVVGNLGRAVAPGWRDGIEDPLLVEDLTAALHGDPEQRLPSAHQLAERLRSLDERRSLAEEEARHLREEVERERLLVEATRRRKLYRLGFAASSVVLVLLLAFASWALAGKRKEAEARSQEEQARLQAERVTQFLLELFDSADPIASPGTGPEGVELSAIELLERGADRLAVAFADAPEVRARLADKLGMVFQHFGRHERARELIEEGLALRRAIYGADHPDVAESLGNLGYSASRSSPGEGEAFLREALEVRRSYLPPDHPDLLSSFEGLASALRNYGKLTEAEALARESFEIRMRSMNPRSLEVASVSYDLGRILFERGELAEADILLRRSLGLRISLLGPRHYLVAQSLFGSALVMTARNQHEEAESMLGEALAILEATFSTENRDIAHTKQRLAEALAGRGELVEAESLARQAISEYERSVTARHPFLADARSSLARLLVLVGDFEEAGTLVAKALETLMKEYPADHWRIWQARALESIIEASSARSLGLELDLKLSCRNIVESTGRQSVANRQCREYLVDLYEAWDMPVEAERSRESWIEAGGSPELREKRKKAAAEIRAARESATATDGGA